MKTRTAAIALTCLALATLIISGAAIFSSSRVYSVLSLSEADSSLVPLSSVTVTNTKQPSSEVSAQSSAPETTSAPEGTDTSSGTSGEDAPSDSSEPEKTDADLTVASVITDVSPEDEEEKFYLFLISDGDGESLCIRDESGNEHFRRSVSTGKLSGKDRGALEAGMEFSDAASAEEAMWELLT